jgi:hypothetical protein
MLYVSTGTIPAQTQPEGRNSLARVRKPRVRWPEEEQSAVGAAQTGGPHSTGPPFILIFCKPHGLLLFAFGDAPEQIAICLRPQDFCTAAVLMQKA